MDAILSGKDILKADDLARELVEVPEWKGSVWVRELTGAERDEYEAGLADQKQSLAVKLKNVRARVVQRGAIAPDGSPLFVPADLPALCGKSGMALDRLFSAILRLSRMDAAGREELQKNSPTPTDGNGSSDGSACNSAAPANGSCSDAAPAVTSPGGGSSPASSPSGLGRRNDAPEKSPSQPTT